MDINSPGQARPFYYDRNPAPACEVDSSTINAGADTALVDYTVPVGKKSLVSLLTVSQFCSTTPGAGGLSQIFITFTPSGGAAVDLDMILFPYTADYDFKSDKYPINMVMTAGDRLYCYGKLISVDGAVTVKSAVFLTEFDV